MKTPFGLVICASFLLSKAIFAQVYNLSDSHQPAGFVAQESQQEQTLPPVVVRPPENYGNYGEVMSPYASGGNGNGISWSSNQIFSDTQRVGPYNQPVWTTQRPWAATRVYVLPPGQVQFEQWVRPTFRRDGKPRYRFLEEIAIGLPGRFQLDIYQRWNVEPNAQNLEEANHEGVQIELRYALADWDVLPMNPTLYAEWVERGGPQEKPDVYEMKLLLGDEIGCNWFYATNFVIEQETSGERELELAWSNALSTTVIDRVLMAGVESNFTSTTVQGSRGDPEDVLTIGPSIQLRPTNRTFIDFTTLFGVTGHAPDAQVYLICGYQFGSRAGPSVRGPTSTIGN